MRSLWLRWAACLVATVAACGTAAANDDWPRKPVRLIVTFTAGGSTDIAARLYAEKLSTALKQQFVVENRAGASGAIGLEAVARAEPDGHTFVVSASASFAALPAIRKLPVDVFQDLTPVGRLSALGLVFAVHPSVPVTDWQEFVAYARREPKKLNYGSGGVGVLAHFVGEYAKQLGQFEMVHIPYKGGSEAQADFLAGQIQVAMEGPLLPYLKAGKGKLLAYIDETRHPDFPDVPTMRELFPQWAIYTWFGVMAPAKTPPAIVRRMNVALAEAARSPDLTARLAELSQRASVNTPEEMGAQMRREHALYTRLARELDIRAE